MKNRHGHQWLCWMPTGTITRFKYNEHTKYSEVVVLSTTATSVYCCAYLVWCTWYCAIRPGITSITAVKPPRAQIAAAAGCRGQKETLQNRRRKDQQRSFLRPINDALASWKNRKACFCFLSEIEYKEHSWCLVYLASLFCKRM